MENCLRIMYVPPVCDESLTELSHLITTLSFISHFSIYEAGLVYSSVITELATLSLSSLRKGI